MVASCAAVRLFGTFSAGSTLAVIDGAGLGGLLRSPAVVSPRSRLVKPETRSQNAGATVGVELASSFERLAP